MSKSFSLTSFITRASWLALLSTVLLLSVSLNISLAASSCPNCDIVDSLLVPCNSSLQLNTWPGTMVYQSTQAQAPCACNQNYYDQINACLVCQSSSSAHYSVKDLADYQLVCLSYNQQWKQINLPNSTTTTTTTTATTTTTSLATATTTTTSTSASGSTGDLIVKDNSSNLSSGAVAGIVVSIIALIVALTVAGYVWGKRRRDRAQEVPDLEDFKYRDTHSESYMEAAALPQYTGMIQSSLPPISKVSNLRVMNPDSEDEEAAAAAASGRQRQSKPQSFEVQRTTPPGWRRGSFDDD